MVEFIANGSETRTNCLHQLLSHQVISDSTAVTPETLQTYIYTHTYTHSQIMIFCYLLRGQVAGINFLEQVLEGASIDDFKRINHIAQRLGHLAAVLVAHNRV
jgi:hypothetical protein